MTSLAGRFAPLFTGVDELGNAISYRDPKRLVWLLGGLSTFSVPFVAMGIYALTGGAAWATLFIPLYIFGVVPLLDAIVGEELGNPPEAVVPELSSDPFYMRVAYILVLAGHASVIGGIAFLATQPLPLWSLLPTLLGLGFVNGTLINIGHELGHKTTKLDRFFAKLSLGAVGYGHFTIEHNLGHHKNVSTPQDCASSRLGESVYHFALREQPGALLGGLKIEAKRLERRGHGFWTHRNDILQSYAITMGIAAILVLTLGWKALPIIIAHHAIAWFALTMVNYVEHYGLLRQRLDNGRYELCSPRHSWNTNHLVSNVMQINLQRHSDHHSHPMRPYQALRTYDDLPSLPSGYPGCLVLAAIPPLWFRVMNPKVLAWAGGDLSKTNIHEPARVRLEARYGSAAGQADASS